jgi:molybdopterin-guanine dinucleotide biosynthesis protein
MKMNRLTNKMTELILEACIKLLDRYITDIILCKDRAQLQTLRPRIVEGFKAVQGIVDCMSAGRRRRLNTEIVAGIRKIVLNISENRGVELVRESDEWHIKAFEDLQKHAAESIDRMIMQPPRFGKSNAADALLEGLKAAGAKVVCVKVERRKLEECPHADTCESFRKNGIRVVSDPPARENDPEPPTDPAPDEETAAKDPEENPAGA